MRDRLITAVALYGTKAGALKGLLEAVQGICRDRLGEAFRPYTLDQIHGTVIRLDGAADTRSGLIVNQRYLEVTGTARGMDHARAADILTTRLTPALPIRIGGYLPGAPAAFSSRGRHPYERMFSVQQEALVLMGWPVATVMNGISHRPLDELRRAMNDANIFHWYHNSWTDIDNDFHLVIGHLSRVLGNDAPDAARAVRAYLARHPVEIEVGVEQMTIIASRSSTLAPAEFVGRLPLDPAEIVSLYR